MVRRRRPRLIVLLTIFFLVMAPGSIFAAESPEEPLDEYQVKAAFLFNFARFVDWPAAAFRNAGEPFSICVFGEDPFGKALDNLIAGKTTGGRPIAVQRISDVRRAVGCHMLFVGSQAGNRALATLATTKQAGVLTVGDSEIPASGGMIIHFVMENGKVRFEINAAEADRAGLHISAKLLSLAQPRGHGK